MTRPYKHAGSWHRPLSRKTATHRHLETTFQQEQAAAHQTPITQAAKPQEQAQATPGRGPTGCNVGFRGQGLAPRYRQSLRNALATHLGLHHGGQPDVIYDQHSSKYLDPGDQIVIQHIHALHQLVHHWPQDHRPHIESAWLQLRNKLSKQQHPSCQGTYGRQLDLPP